MNNQTKSKITGRCVYEDIALTKIERLRIWKRGVREAMRTIPPKTRSVCVQVFEGDPRYDSIFSSVLVTRESYLSDLPPRAIIHS